MKKYVTKAYFSEALGMEVIDLHHTHTVFERDRSPRKSGLLDAHGNDLFSVEEMDQIGFIRRLVSPGEH